MAALECLYFSVVRSVSISTSFRSSRLGGCVSDILRSDPAKYSTDRQSERRNHLDLQINLLAEKEATSILKALHEMAAHFYIRLTTQGESQELSQNTAVESIARNLRPKNENLVSRGCRS